MNTRGISLISALLVNILIFNYVYKLEKITCECSENWKRDYIKYYSFATIIIITLIAIIKFSNISYSAGAARFLSTLYSIFGVVNIYALFTYSQTIVIDHCDCTKSWERTFIYYYSMIMLVLYLLMISSIFFMVLFASDVKKYQLKQLRKLNKLNNK